MGARVHKKNWLFRERRRLTGFEGRPRVIKVRRDADRHTRDARGLEGELGRVLKLILIDILLRENEGFS